MGDIHHCFHQGSRQSPLLAKMGGDLGSPSFPPVKAVARATPCQCREARRFLPSFGVSLFLCSKNFSALLTREHWELCVCVFFFFCGHGFINILNIVNILIW